MSDDRETNPVGIDSQEELNTTFNNDQLINTSSCNISLSESQDFRLEVIEDSQEFGGKLDPPVQTQGKDMDEEETKAISEPLVINANLSLTTAVEPETFIDKNVIESKISRVQNSDHVDTHNDPNLQKSSEDDIIQCTPPKETTSAIKRKGSVIEELPSKQQKLSSVEEILDPATLLLDGMKNGIENFNKDSEKTVNNSDEENIIVAETQDTCIGLSAVPCAAHIIQETQDVLSTTNLEKQPELYENGGNQSFIADNINNEKLKSLVLQSNIDPIDSMAKLIDPSEDVTDKNTNISTELVTTSNDQTCEIVNLKDKKDIAPSDANVKSISSEKLVTDQNLETSEESINASNIINVAAKNLKNKQELFNVDTDINKLSSREDSKIAEDHKSRMSIEVIYDSIKSEKDQKKRPKELVEIDEEGEKIVLDSSQEEIEALKVIKPTAEKSSSDFSYKSAISTQLLSSNSENTPKCNSKQVSEQNFGLLNNSETNLSLCTEKSLSYTNKNVVSTSKDAEMLSISENEVSIGDEKVMTSGKIPLLFEKEIGVFVRLKCLLQVDEITKDFLDKELISVQCTSSNEITSTHKLNDDGSLADISGNDKMDKKDCSPGSVTSNPQPYCLNHRHSVASTISSSSSASSAASLAAKLVMKEPNLPPPRTMKKVMKADTSHTTDKIMDASFDRLSKEWRNSQLLAKTILCFVNGELAASDLCNYTNDRFDEPLKKIHSSTPEITQEEKIGFTPKSAKKEKTKRRFRTKISQTRKNLKNQVSKIEENKNHNESDTLSEKYSINNLSREKMSTSDELLMGKDVFAKWADKNYYPGKVIDKNKTKYKVKFYDGEAKLLIEDFIIPMPETLTKGLSVYAFTKQNDFGVCGIISDIEFENGNIVYVVETDEHEKLKVKKEDIFLSNDQAQILKEEVNMETKGPITPRRWDKFTLDNVVEGQRRSKRVASPAFSTPKTKLLKKSLLIAEPSSSGLTPKSKREEKSLGDQSSDSIVSIKDEVTGVQQEEYGVSNESLIKGPKSRVKGRSRSKRKSENNETVALLGPIPPPGSSLFKGTSFLLTCASLEMLDKHQLGDNDTNSEAGTSSEEQWLHKPFVRDRLQEQITAGGGKIYEKFEEIPKDEYKNTKLITNLPNHTAKSLLCLSVGIPSYNHGWIIRCCEENRVVNPAENVLPAGWSLENQKYIEFYDRTSSKPLAETIIIIPNLESEYKFGSFWRQICENAGAVVLLAENAESMEGFVGNAIVVSNPRCPAWAVKKANELKLPMVSTTWVVQSLVKGAISDYESKDFYKYNYTRT
ncbi:uncharacterized protein [Prorops nasuta]|uniref:uncharacterized protein n=1 Tax=Prorops nasuta TaxID=863751 RepID=UPI0034CEB186